MTADADVASPWPFTPRRVMRAQREAAEALGLPYEAPIPKLSGAPATEFGAAIPLDDGLF
jgi:hypothetical protein